MTAMILSFCIVITIIMVLFAPFVASALVFVVVGRRVWSDGVLGGGAAASEMHRGYYHPPLIRLYTSERALLQSLHSQDTG